MRTTVRLDDALLDQAKREARRRGLTLTALLEQGLRLTLAQARPAHHRAAVSLPVCKLGGGTCPGVDLDDGAAVLDLMEGRG